MRGDNLSLKRLSLSMDVEDFSESPWSSLVAGSIVGDEREMWEKWSERKEL
jgi:hypothetical protein